MALPLNPDLPISYQVPGVYVFLSRAGAAPPATNRRVLFLGYRTSAGSAQAGTPYRILSEDDVIRLAGKGSDLHRMVRAFMAQSPTTGADLWILPMTAPSGTAQTRLLTFLQSPNGAALGTGNTGAVAAGFVTVWICGYRFDTQIANGDTYATIAANVCAQIVAGQDVLPCTAAVVGSTITLTMRHAALTSADLPVMVTFSSSSMAVACSPGSLTFASAATGAGTAQIGVGTQVSNTATISNTDTANAITAAFITAVNNTASFPVTAAQTAPDATATLFYVEDRVFNWAFSSISTGITTTLTPAWGSNAAGLPSSATPSLSTVLTTLNAQQAFKLWVTNFTGAGSVVTASGQTRSGSNSDYSVLGTLSSNLETQGNGLNCKGQMLVLADTRALATTGSIPTGTTPLLTASPRYFVSWAPASPQQAVESAARIASIIMGRLDYPNFNYAGQVLLTDQRTPYLLPHDAVRPSDSDVNSAMLTYFLTPLRSNSNGQMAIVSGRTTARPSESMDFRYSFWGVALADDFIRDDLRASLPVAIAGKNLKQFTPPHTQFTTDLEAIKTAVASRVAYYDTLDIFDGADSLLPGLGAEINGSLPSRVDVKLLKRFAIPAEQVSVFTQMAA
jgi:hypothetical protein